MDPSSDLPPPPQSPPPVLNYLTPTCAMRAASGGLLLMGLAFVALPLLFLLLVFVDASDFRRELLEMIVPLLIGGFIAAWGLTYIVAAIMIRYGRAALARLALIMVILQTLATLALTLRTLARMWTYDIYDGLAMPLIVTIALAFVNVGFAAVIFELRQVIRESHHHALPRQDSAPPEKF